VIDDYEPEDAWDATDAPDDQAINLARRIALLDGGDVPIARSISVLLDIITERVEIEQRRRVLTGRDRLRAAQLIDDLVFVRRRL